MRTSRGIHRLHDPRVSGATAGAIGASAFVLVNRADLPGVLSTLSLAAWGVALVAWVVLVLVLPRDLTPLPAPAPRAGAVYGGSVLGMVVLIIASARVLGAVDRAELVPAAVVAAVGLHFLPFARVFHAPVFALLGLLLAVLGVGGVALGLAGVTDAAPGAAVLAGLTMMTVVALDARR